MAIFVSKSIIYISSKKSANQIIALFIIIYNSSVLKFVFNLAYDGTILVLTTQNESITFPFCSSDTCSK